MATLALPCLVFDTTLYTVADGVHRPRGDIDELRLLDKPSWPTSHGWVLTYDPTTLATFLWNPKSVAGVAHRNIITLPSFGPTPPPAGSICVLSGKPKGREIHEPWGSQFIWYCHVSGSKSTSMVTETWVRYEYNIRTQRKEGKFGRLSKRREKRSIHSLTSCNGKFYHNITSHSYVMLDFSSPDSQPVFTRVRMEPLSVFPQTFKAGGYVSGFNYEIDINGDLHLVLIFKGEENEVVDVVVYRVLEK
uniref:KIB1-4 beta-propeller domain-containing protein n=1 Tax=Leersia perrieri TaxID=77586 RepID=A0A0D9WLI3_9ORYZ